VIERREINVRPRARLDFSIPCCSPGQRGITPAFEDGAPHLSAEGTSTPNDSHAAQCRQRLTSRAPVRHWLQLLALDHWRHSRRDRQLESGFCFGHCMLRYIRDGDLDSGTSQSASCPRSSAEPVIKNLDRPLSLPGTSRYFAATPDVGRFRTEADMNRQVRPAASVANDPGSR
jgi:hypothetical protein